MKFLKIIKDIIKRYSSLGLPVGLTVAAIVILLVAVLINRGVKKGMAESLSTGESISRLVRNAPTLKQVEIEKAYQQQCKADADKIDSVVLRTTQRELVAYNVFPEPTDMSRYIFDSYAEKYKSAIDGLIDKVNGGDAPSDKELSADLVGTANTRNSRNQDEYSRKMINARCLKRAESIGLYVNPNAFDWYNYWNQFTYTGRNAAIQDCWNSQLAFWVYEDIIDTINNLKGNTHSVIASPVKRLGGISFRKLVTITQKRGDNSKSTAQKDIPYMINDNDRLPILGTDAWTGRVTNNDIDVFHFSLAVIVEVDKIPDFLRELCSEKHHTFTGWDGKQQPVEGVHNQITILSSKIEPVIRDSLEHTNYRYGSKAVVQWSGVCEYVLEKKAYAEILPASVKQAMEEPGNVKKKKKKKKKKK